MVVPWKILNLKPEYRDMFGEGYYPMVIIENGVLDKYTMVRARFANENDKDSELGTIAHTIDNTTGKVLTLFVESSKVFLMDVKELEKIVDERELIAGEEYFKNKEKEEAKENQDDLKKAKALGKEFKQKTETIIKEKDSKKTKGKK